MNLIKHDGKRCIKKLAFMAKRRGLSTRLNSDYLTISERVRDALATNKPVVALESTIITHGMPWPNNYQTAVEIENIIESTNAVPATVGFLNGKLKVGLDQKEIQLMAESCHDAVKLSRRDLSYIIAQATSGSKKIIGGI
jgi:pseudouridine-5'-phosphate glycosidase